MTFLKLATIAAAGLIGFSITEYSIRNYTDMNMNCLHQKSFVSDLLYDTITYSVKTLEEKAIEGYDYNKLKIDTREYVNDIHDITTESSTSQKTICKTFMGSNNDYIVYDINKSDDGDVYVRVKYLDPAQEAQLDFLIQENAILKAQLESIK